MKLYSEKFKFNQNVFDVNSKFYILDVSLYLKIIRLNNPSLPETFLCQINKDFARILCLENENQAELNIDFNNFYELYKDSSNFDIILYSIMRAMVEYKILPNTRELADFKTKFLVYDKKSFVELLSIFPELFVDKYKVVLYSAMVDGIEIMYKYCKQFDLYKYCYEATLFAKQYIDDFVSFIGKTENLDHPIMNNSISPELYFAKCEQIIERIKLFEI